MGGSNFVGSESGQKQSVKLLQNMAYSTFQHPPTPTQSVYTVHLVWEGGEGGGGQREGIVEGQHSTVHKYSSSPSMGGATAHKLGRKYKP